MIRNSTKTPARVDRRFRPSRKAELIAGGLIVLAMLVLFALVRPTSDAPSPAAPDWLTYSDFSQDMPTISTAERVGTITRRAQASDVLEVLGASSEDADSAMDALRETGLLSRSKLAAGTVLTAYFDEAANEGLGELVSVSLRVDPRTTLLATRKPDGSFMTSTLTARVFDGTRRIAGTIETTLADALTAQGGPQDLAGDVAALFPDDTQLALGGRKGERFDIVYQVAEDERGNVLETGDLLFAAYNGKQSNGSWYRFEPSDTGRAEFYNRQGSTQKPLLTRYPLGYAQISSGFGRRLHPVSGLLLLHTGVDFRAPIGTPIYAAGDGVISQMGWGDGYGRQIFITHKRGFETVYAHMSGFNTQLSPGMSVKRGDLIGYVGNSGTATGPHLHFEIRENGRYVNPVSLNLPSGRSLARNPEEMDKLREQISKIDTLRGATGPLTTARLTTMTIPTNP